MTSPDGAGSHPRSGPRRSGRRPTFGAFGRAACGRVSSLGCVADSRRVHLTWGPVGGRSGARGWMRVLGRCAAPSQWVGPPPGIGPCPPPGITSAALGPTSGEVSPN